MKSIVFSFLIILFTVAGYSDQVFYDKVHNHTIIDPKEQFTAGGLGGQYEVIKFNPLFEAYKIETNGKITKYNYITDNITKKAAKATEKTVLKNKYKAKLAGTWTDEEFEEFLSLRK